ncbi:MAG: hypothetical protein A2479_02100 [Candidatus Magasanikbacteria bacterium RIFOXYC2_FULL_39_8]|nr:MAG: hypothetical protein A2479_02100 [Candidatus Magasanikbacteria bacterium RIFOXYC2_FULL_39_8]
MIWILSIIWIIKYNRSIIFNLKSLFLRHKSLFIASTVFLLGATIAVFSSLHIKEAAGEWKAFYVEPFLLFLILITTAKNKLNKNISISQCLNVNNILFALILCGLATSILAIYQHSTGWMVPYAFWQNRNTFRVTGWYGYPNAVALFVTPLVPFTLYFAVQFFYKIKGVESIKYKVKKYTYTLFFLLSTFSFIFAILYAKSTGGLIGLAAGIGILLLVYKKTRWPTLIIGLVGFVSLVSLPGSNPIKQEVLAQDRSGQIRIAMWGEALALLSDRPILGAGLQSYVDRIVPYHTQVNGENIEIFHLQHNLFISLWVNIGVIGLFGFVWILVSISGIQYVIFKQHKKIPTLNYFLISSILIIVVMGLVDTPYMKNDLAILFWGIIGLLLISPYENLENTTT